MSESPEQQKEPVTPTKPKKSERREETPVAVAEPAKAADVAPIEIEVASEAVAPREPAEAPKASRGLTRHLAQAATLLLALGAGWVAGYATTATSRPAANSPHEAILAIDWSGLASGVQKAQGETLRMAADMQAFKGTLAGLKEAVDRSKQEAAGRFGQLTERLDRIQKTEQEVAAKLAGMTERLEKAERESNARLASASERPTSAQAMPPKSLLQAALQAPAPPPAAPPPPPAVEPGLRTGSIADQSMAEGGKSEQPKTDAKATPIEGWVLREVYDGVALIEGRNKRLLEIAPGQSLSGIGRVESIERRGRAWVVVTTRGVITSQPW